MTIDQLRQFHSARPFHAFDICLADGRRFHVDHPEFLMQSRTGRIVFVVTPEDREVAIDLALVATLERARNGNGSKSSPKPGNESE